VHNHAKLLGVLWIAYSLYLAIGAVTLYLLAHTIFAVPRGNAGFLHPLFIALAFLLWGKAVAGLVTGIGLCQRERWARVLALVVGVIALVNIPIGTALGIYTLWVLLSPAAEAEYQRLSAAA
jgi:hypothetical protein